MRPTAGLPSSRVYDFVADNPGVEFWPVDYTNDPRNIAREPTFVAINATLEVDFLGQCASESLGSVDRVVTEYGVAELRGSSVAERTRRLIAIAHPKFRDELERRAHELGYLSR